MTDARYKTATTLCEKFLTKFAVYNSIHLRSPAFTNNSRILHVHLQELRACCNSQRLNKYVARWNSSLVSLEGEDSRVRMLYWTECRRHGSAGQRVSDWLIKRAGAYGGVAKRPPT